jgi:hypothetical protein
MAQRVKMKLGAVNGTQFFICLFICLLRGIFATVRMEEERTREEDNNQEAHLNKDND